MTHSDDDVDRAALALLLAGIDAKKIGKELSGVTVWFTLQGTKVCRKGAAEKLTSPIFKKFGTLADLLTVAVKAGAKLGGCPFCLDSSRSRNRSISTGWSARGATTWRRRWGRPT